MIKRASTIMKKLRTICNRNWRS